ncbi:MAG TPA: hypothetical protein VEU52_05400 [Candidatus Limnocylindrales bacterium]|nr:hypothetical protein [Candidatus Limnocylindrales bacterium]
MRRLLLQFALAGILAAAAAPVALAQTQSFSDLPPAPVASGGAQTIDGIAARIEDDVLTESEVRELGAFQQVVEGKAKSRDERIRELADQWIVRGDAKTAKFAHPSEADIDHAYAKLLEQFPSEADFKARCAAAGLTHSALRRILGDQLYLSRFLDYRFRPAIQIDEKQVGAYYEDEFASVLRKRGQPVPPLDDVDEEIREVLIQRAISDRAAKWLDDARERLKIDVVALGGAS